MTDASKDDGGESILEEAHRLTHGPRNVDYGHPLDDYTRTAALVSAMLANKLKEPLTAEEAALFMCCAKLSRHMNAPKRDNMTDLAGYAWVSWACTEERKRRALEADISRSEAVTLIPDPPKVETEDLSGRHKLPFYCPELPYELQCYHLNPAQGHPCRNPGVMDERRKLIIPQPE